MSFLSKNIKLFQLSSKSKFLRFMGEVNLNNGNETKSDILPWDIFETDVTYLLLKNIRVFQSMTFKITFSQFYD